MLPGCHCCDLPLPHWATTAQTISDCNTLTDTMPIFHGFTLGLADCSKGARRTFGDNWIGAFGCPIFGSTALLDTQSTVSEQLKWWYHLPLLQQHHYWYLRRLSGMVCDHPLVQLPITRYVSSFGVLLVISYAIYTWHRWWIINRLYLYVYIIISHSYAVISRGFHWHWIGIVDRLCIASLYPCSLVSVPLACSIPLTKWQTSCHCGKLIYRYIVSSVWDWKLSL